MNDIKIVYWLLRGDFNVASSRLQGYLIHDTLNKNFSNAFRSEIILRPPIWLDTVPWTTDMYCEFAEITRGQIVVMQKMFGAEMEHLVQLIQESGGVVIYIHCDLDEENKIPLLCNTLVVPSRKMAKWYKKQGCKNIKIIDDPVENIWNAPIYATVNKKITVGWIGHSNNWETLNKLRAVLQKKEFSDYRLVTISNHNEADIKWTPEIVKETIRSFDIAVIPIINSKESEVKSSNRVTMFMGAGIPVIAGALPAYEEVIINGQNGYIFNTEEELSKQLIKLRDPELRKKMGLAGIETVKNNYSILNTTKKWTEVFNAHDLDISPSLSTKLLNKKIGVLKFKSAYLFYKLLKQKNAIKANQFLGDLHREFRMNPTWFKFKTLVLIYLKLDK